MRVVNDSISLSSRKYNSGFYVGIIIPNLSLESNIRRNVDTNYLENIIAFKYIDKKYLASCSYLTKG